LKITDRYTARTNPSPGEIVRHGPNSLSFFGLEAATQIYGVRSNVSKSEGYATMSASRTPNLISATDKTLHGFKRRVISQTLTEESLKSMEPRIVARIEKFVELLGEGASDSAELEGWTPRSSLQAQADWLTFDVMSDLLFGKSLGLLDSPDARWLPSVVRKIAQLAATVSVRRRAFRACEHHTTEHTADHSISRVSYSPA
jgi:cytochrome P450